jgi:flagellar assembly protein FliH
MAELFKSIQICPEPFYLGENPEKVVALDAKVLDAPEMPALFLLLLQQAQDVSFKAGVDEGQKQQLDAFKQQEETLQTLIQTIPEAISQQRLTLKNEITHIVLTIIEQLFIHNQTNPKIIEDQIHHILQQLNSLDTAELCLHPNDIALLQNGEITVSTKTQGLKVSADPNLLPGGCIVKSNHGVFDASIEGQIERLKQTLLSFKERSTHASPH